MRWLVILLLAILCNLPWSAYANAEQNQAKSERSASQNVLGVKVKTSDQSYAEAAKQKKDSPSNEARTADATETLVWITGVLAFFTALLWVSTNLLVRDANETAKHDLRAYLTAADGTLGGIPGTTVLRAEVALTNSGRTPAHNVRYAITGALRPSGEVGTFPEPDLSTRKQPIAPNAHWTVGYEFINMIADDLDDVLNDRKWVYVWGRAEYVDIFNRTHTLKFRYRNIVKQVGFDVERRARTVAGWKFYPEEEGNETT
ncbi:MAG: hypothetical protein A3C13_02560 [Candidatus Lloydbacteria bacterium RIFCSPHIGHO2_02_FULL_50_11]|nr:MAG: hypothetical protein A3C13_02560 [Candidatus Lloydbacteria bacterium RIFCSPHIGHO2_02_FULL_50_11]